MSKNLSDEQLRQIRASESGFSQEPRPENKEVLLQLENERNHEYKSLKDDPDQWDNPDVLTFLESFGGEVCMDDDNSMYTFLKTFLEKRGNRGNKRIEDYVDKHRMKDRVEICKEYAQILAEISKIVFQMCNNPQHADYNKREIIPRIEYHAKSRVIERNFDKFWDKDPERKGPGFMDCQDSEILAEIKVETEAICNDLMPYLVYKLNSYVENGSKNERSGREHYRHQVGIALSHLFARLLGKEQRELALQFAGPMPNEIAISRDQLQAKLAEVTARNKQQGEQQGDKIEALTAEKERLIAELAEEKEGKAVLEKELQALKDKIAVGIKQARKSVDDKSKSVRNLKARPMLEPNAAKAILSDLEADLSDNSDK